MLLHCRGGGGQDFPQEAIQCLDIVLRSSMALRPDVATFARGFFFTEPQFCSSIGNGAEASTLFPPNSRSMLQRHR